MFIFFKTLHQILKLLNSETAPSQLSAGIVFGMLIGLSPISALHNAILLLVVFLFRVNLSMFFLSFGFFSLLSFVLDPVFDWIGYWTLVDLKMARPLWIEISTGAIWPFFRLNNTIVMGSLVFGLFLALPLFFISSKGVLNYRLRWREQLKESKFVKMLRATPLYGFYEKYQGFKEKMSVIS